MIFIFIIIGIGVPIYLFYDMLTEGKNSKKSSIQKLMNSKGQY